MDEQAKLGLNLTTYQNTDFTVIWLFLNTPKIDLQKYNWNTDIKLANVFQNSMKAKRTILIFN